MTPPLAEFVIPAFNASATIGRTLDSLVAQTEPRWRAIVVDDGSTDGTGPCAASRGEARVRVMRQPNGGPSAARNAGFRETLAPFVCFLDADDTIEPAFLERMLPATGGSPVGSACGCRTVDPDGRELDAAPPPGADALTREGLLRLDPPPIMSVLHRRDVLRAVAGAGGVFNPTLRAFEDWDVLRRLGERFGGAGFAPVHSPLVSYRVVRGSLSRDTGRTLETGLELLTRFGDPPSRRAHMLRTLAAAVARDEDALARDLRARLGVLAEPDVQDFLAALEWHAVRRWLVPRAELDTVAEEACDLVRRLLDGDPALGRVLSLVRCWGGAAWDAAVRRASELARGGRVVVFGLGRNGSHALAAAARLGVRCVAADDDETRAPAGVERIRPSQIGPRDVVLVTPSNRDRIIARLRALGCDRIVTPGDAGCVRQSA